MNDRIKTPFPQNYGVMTGTLRDVLKKHAQDRCETFFLYAFTMAALVDRLNARHGTTLGHMDGVQMKASDQYGDGNRSDNDEVYAFFKHKKKDKNILDCYATDFAREDAAHMNNLGIDPGTRQIFATFAKPDVDKVALSLFEILKSSCGRTRQLPASVNTGADKVVDNCHVRLIKIVLDGTEPVSSAKMQAYVDECRRSMQASLVRHKANGNDGVVACRERYIAFYDDMAAVEKAYGSARDAVYYECVGLGLDPTDYYTPLVR